MIGRRRVVYQDLSEGHSLFENPLVEQLDKFIIPQPDDVPENMFIVLSEAGCRRSRADRGLREPEGRSEVAMGTYLCMDQLTIESPRIQLRIFN